MKKAIERSAANPGGYVGTQAGRWRIGEIVSLALRERPGELDIPRVIAHEAGGVVDAWKIDCQEEYGGEKNDDRRRNTHRAAHRIGVAPPPDCMDASVGATPLESK